MWSIIHFFVLLSAEPVVIINETIRMKRGCSWVMQWPEMNADLLISFRTKGSNMNYGRNFTFPTLAHLPICAQPHIIHIQAWHTSSTKLNNVLNEHDSTFLHFALLETHFINRYGLKSDMFYIWSKWFHPEFFYYCLCIFAFIESGLLFFVKFVVNIWTF